MGGGSGLSADTSALCKPPAGSQPLAVHGLQPGPEAKLLQAANAPRTPIPHFFFVIHLSCSSGSPLGLPATLPKNILF